jgi:hypothetical protein
VIDNARTRALLEQWKREEHASMGVDPDGIAYLDAADRIEVAREAYRAALADASDPAERRRYSVPGAAAELL